ncbi:hypothetical protein LXL04_039015 [Taraxacum kok-saghyz]
MVQFVTSIPSRRLHIRNRILRWTRFNKKTNFVNSWAESFFPFMTSPLFSSFNFLETADDDEVPVVGFSDASTDVTGSGRCETCKEWL